MSQKRAHSFLAAVIVLALVPAVAGALEGSVILGFGATYQAADGESSTHRGIDVGTPAGAEIDSPVSGQVRFAGRVPGPGGASVWCVSIESEHGTVTMLPLEQVWLSEGDGVEVGDPVATVATTGDPSSAEPHLHLGLKRGGVYLDPTSLLAPLAPAKASDAPVVPDAEEEQRAPAPTVASGAQPQSSPRAVPIVETAASLPVPSATTQPVEIPVAGQPGVSVPTPATASPVGAAPRIALSLPTRMPVGTAASSLASLRAAADGVPAWKGVGAPALAVLGAACAASAMIVTRKALVRRTTAVGPVSDRLGIMLQHLKAGDTLCGLTSCSGPLPSQSRGH